MSKRVKILAGTALLVALVGLVAAVPAFAQGPMSDGAFGRQGISRAFGMLGGGPWAMFDAAAEALGLEPVELFNELRAGNSPADIAEAQGVELEALYDAVKAARAEAMRDAIEQAVEDGRLSQERADWILEGLEQGFMPLGRNFGHGSRGPGGCEGHNGNSSWTPSVTPGSSSL